MVQVARRLDHLRHDRPLYKGEPERERRARPLYQAVHQSLMHRILALAPPKEDFAQLGAASRPHLQAILGPESGIIERATRTCGSGNSVHASRFGGTLAFRPLRNETTRALVAQIVAFDNEGIPHITPLVEGIELRRGFTAEAPACVVQARPDGTLRVAAHREIEEHLPFVEKHGGGMTCNRCHRTAKDVGARDLSVQEVIAVDRLRDAQVDGLANQLWKRLEYKINWETGAVSSARE
jgi:hypothetical protein